MFIFRIAGVGLYISGLIWGLNDGFGVSFFCLLTLLGVWLR